MKKIASTAAMKATTTTTIGSKATTTSGFLTSPMMTFARTPRKSPPEPALFDFDLKAFNTSSTSSKKKKSSVISLVASSPSQKISDLKDLVSSSSDSLKRNLDISHSAFLKEFEASHSRLSKRYKIHAQTCQQVMDDAEKEYKKLSDLITENVEAMKTSYAESIAKAEASTTRVCKTSIAELAQNMEKAIEGLRSHYRIPMTAA